MAWTLGTSNPTPSNTSPSTKLYLLIIPKQFHQLGTTYPNTQEPTEVILIQTTMLGLVLITQAQVIALPQFPA